MGNPLFSVVPSFVPLLLVKTISYIYRDALSRLEEYIFLALSAITISFWRNDHG
jgi:hypothetical protein